MNTLNLIADKRTLNLSKIAINDSLLQTPAFLYHEDKIISNLKYLKNRFLNTNSVNLLFSLKPFAVLDGITIMKDLINGFAASSLFEAKLAREAIGYDGTIHITTPGLKSNEIGSINEICDYLSFNSISQLKLFKKRIDSEINCGLRLNPKLSFIRDDRYDPCRKYSKLGVPINTLSDLVDKKSNALQGITGLHFHSNCDSLNFSQLLATVRHIEGYLSDFLQRIEWVNLGGGYLFNEASDQHAFYEVVELLNSKYGLEIFIEPGASIIRSAGYLVSTVLDLFKSDGKKIVILDTSVNHMPEVFEYQFEPDVIDHVEDGNYKYILAGCSCLAGDIFGEYAFIQPLEIGSKIIFQNVGAYTLVKAHMFNGINLPSIYALTESGSLILKKEFTYQDFANRNGVEEKENVLI